MNDDRFWAMIESAWKAVGGKSAMRRKLAQGKLPEEKAEVLLESLDDVIAELHRLLDALSAADLLAFDRILEKKLFDIDRAEIQERTDGSEDGFLYCRGFIVAIGREFYEAVSADPARALLDLECEEICFLPLRLHEQKFGSVPASGISRETGSNKLGWPGRTQRG